MYGEAAKPLVETACGTEGQSIVHHTVLFVSRCDEASLRLDFIIYRVLKKKLTELEETFPVYVWSGSVVVPYARVPLLGPYDMRLVLGHTIFTHFVRR